jgi:hypothetical protein
MNEQQLTAVKQALEALKMWITPNWAGTGVDKANAAHAALQSIISQDALDKKAENARELGLTYDDAPAPVQSAERGEPVAWMVDVDLANYQGQSEFRTILAWNAKPVWSGTHEINEVLKAVPLYTAPAAQKPWVGLTNNEIALIHADYPNPQGFARAIEAKLKAKNEWKEKNT